MCVEHSVLPTGEWYLVTPDCGFTVGRVRAEGRGKHALSVH